MLPASKDKVKAALKVAYVSNKDPQVRTILSNAYVYLGNFFDGVGSTPINLGLPKSTDVSAEGQPDPTSVMKALEESLPWQKRTLAEANALREEFEQFKSTVRT
jgi:hypothetical protein